MATIAELLKKLKDGTATQKDLQEYASLLGLESGSQAAEAILESGIDGEELYQLSTQLLHDDYLKISDFADALQNASYEAEGLSLRAIRPEFSKADVRDALAKIAQKETVTKEFIASEIGLVSQKVADRHMQANAEAANNVGLQAMVSREYVSGGFGEHTTSKHPKSCSFCSQRSTHGKALPYREAYSKGVFQRHPNCRCIITYTNTAGETTRQTGKGKWQRIDQNAIVARKNFEIDDNLPTFEEVKARIREGRLPKVELDLYDLTFVEDERPYFPPDHIMAGKGCKTKRQIDDIDRLVRDYRFFDADEKNWSKQKAQYQVYDQYGQIRMIEVHWYQHPNVGKTEDKIKERFGTIFVDEWEE